MRIFGILKTLSLVVLPLLLISCSSDSKEEPSEVEQEMLEEQVLRDKADFDIGAAVTTSALKNSDYKEVLSTHYSKITPEFEMKMSHVWESPDSYNWEAADGLVEFAKDHDMEVHGHTLIWYKGFPQWLIEKDLDSVAFEKEVKQYITAVVSRYRGEIQSWDVVNEVFGDGGGLREENLLRSMFKDPVGFYGRCFKYAKEADPEALLFYNDYNVVLDSGKRKAIKDMVDRFQRQGYPIDGIGDQFHYMVSTDKEQIASGFKDMASTGLLMHISELDIRVNVEQNDSYVFNEAEAKKQADTYHRIVKMYNELPDDQKFAITTWGVSDRQTWLLDFWHLKEYPLLFDRNFNPKEAYFGFLDALD